MDAASIDPFAVAGDAAVDVFHRVAEPDQRRSRFECIASADAAGRIIAHHARARRQPEAVRDALARFDAAPVLRAPMALADPASYPDPGALGRPLDLFVYLEFLRAFAVAEMAIARFADTLDGPGTPPVADTAAALRLLLDFNRTARARPICDAAWPGLMRRAMAPGAAGRDTAGYALRVMGDLMLRLGDAARALTAHEAALRLGETRFRRRRAIVAAQTMGDQVALHRHLRAFEARWGLPADLAALAETPQEARP